MQSEASLASSEPIFRAIIEGGGVFTLKPRGNSMRPTILPGRDSVSIVRLDGRAALYDILFYKRPNGQFVLHRVAQVGEEDYTLCGDYQVQMERGVKPEWVIGVVQSISRPGRKELVRGTRAFRNAALRRSCSRPLRRLRRRAALLYHKLIGR